MPSRSAACSRRIRPAVVVILETEIWPLLYREVKRAGCALLVVNGRISDRAFPRYSRWRFFFRHALELPDAIFVQSEQDRERYLEIGRARRPGRDVRQPQVRRLAARWRAAADWFATCSLDCFPARSGLRPAPCRKPMQPTSMKTKPWCSAFVELAQTYPRLLLILVPRKPERFDSAADVLRAAGVRYVRRSRETIPPDLALPCAVLLDSIGELASLFPLADVVFMGGTLARRGGHNLLEPAACGRAIVTGPHLENFSAIAAEFRKDAAMVEIASPDELADAVEMLLGDAQLRDRLGARAAEVAGKHRGATSKAAGEILKWQDLMVPSGRPRGWRVSPAVAAVQSLDRRKQTEAKPGCRTRATAGYARGEYRRNQHGRGRKDSHGRLSDSNECASSAAIPPSLLAATVEDPSSPVS